MITEAWAADGAEVAGEAALRRWLTDGAAGAGPPAGSTRPAGPPTTCSGRSASTTPTPTWCSRTPLRSHGLTGRDAAFATELAAGTLRRRGTYDAILAACLDRPLAKVEAKVLDVLRLGTHQLLSMRVPAHAAISTTVDLVRDRAGQRPAGFVNAVLRRVAEHDLAEWVARVAPDRAVDPVGFAEVAHTHPRWVVDELAAALGGSTDAEELDALLAADNEPPRVVLVARPGRADPRRSCPASRPPGRPTAWSWPGGDPGAVPAVAEGRAGVQDEGSQLVALALARAAVDGPRRPLARPLRRPRRQGGAAGRPGGGARRPADSRRSGSRTGPRWSAARWRGLRASRRTVVADGTRPPWRPGTFDRVLVDAPCSGLGALRRRPESRWRRSPADVEALVPLQRALLGSALDSVRPGRRGPLRHLLAGARRDPGGGGGPAGRP